MRPFYFFILLVSFSITGSAQTDTPPKIPIDRTLWHDKLEAMQKAYDRFDGKADSTIELGENEEVRQVIDFAVFNKVNNIRYAIERRDDKSNEKVRYLNNLLRFLDGYQAGFRRRTFSITSFPGLLDSFNATLEKLFAGESLSNLVNDLPYEQARLLTDAFSDARGNKEAQMLVYRKYVTLHPDKIMGSIRPYLNDPLADSLIGIVARKSPAEIFSYAQSNSPEARLIRNSKDTVVQRIAELSRANNAILYFPFLDEVLSGRLPISELSKVVRNGDNADTLGYYRLLVNTAIAYNRRITQMADTPLNAFGPNGLYETLQKKSFTHFVKHINELHERPEAIRMRPVDQLSAIDLYYMIVLNENDIYTSSYRMSYERLIQRFKGGATDSLFAQVGYDHFRKFIKMAANYNKLDDFLQRMPVGSREYVMNRFVENLDKSTSLEDAVDVADSYSSITDKKILAGILEKVTVNEQEALDRNNTRAALIYSLLKNIFKSTDSTNKIDLTALAGIPSIYYLKTNDLKDAQGRIVQQVFFYGDEDGKTFFQPFVNSFPSKDWDITPKKEWVEFRSKKGKVYVFANRPLDYNQNLDDSAQAHLNNYLQTLDMHPAVVVHRGHSYWLPGTLKRMPDGAKIVVLGSCGGYQNLDKILESSPDAHIISTKETGAGYINKPIQDYLNQQFIASNQLDWRSMWKDLSSRLGRDPNMKVREMWEDYIPPYRNLGAIFIKAYNKQMEL